MREEWEIFALKAVDYTEREPVQEQLEQEEMAPLLKQMVCQQQTIIELLKQLTKKD